MLYFCLSKQWDCCQCYGFLMCTQILMHAIAREGCMDPVRVFRPQHGCYCSRDVYRYLTSLHHHQYWKLTERKIPFCISDWNLCQQHSGSGARPAELHPGSCSWHSVPCFSCPQWHWESCVVWAGGVQHKAVFLLSTVTLRVLYCLGRWSSAQNYVFLVHSDADNLVLFGQVEFSTKLCFSCPQWCW